MIPSTPVSILGGGMKTMRTPASSPELNPIEHIWHTLREFLRNEYKPPTYLRITIVTPEICSRYIGHLKKVVEVNVGPLILVISFVPFLI